jgi:hypothetical protein
MGTFLSFSLCPLPAAPEDNQDTQYETEVIPVAVVINIIDINVFVKQRNNKT